MRETMAVQIAALQEMTLADRRQKYHEVFGEETRSRHKDFLRKRIAWRLQANEEGDLSERAKRRAAEIANDADTGATDAPRGADAASLGRALDLVHLSILLLWLLDRSEGQRATARIVAVIRRVLPAFSLAYRLRVLRDLVRDLDEIARLAFYGRATASHTGGAQ